MIYTNKSISSNIADITLMDKTSTTKKRTFLVNISVLHDKNVQTT